MEGRWREIIKYNMGDTAGNNKQEGAKEAETDGKKDVIRSGN